MTHQSLVCNKLRTPGRSFVESLNIGDPMDRSTDIGPMINGPGREKVERHVGEALQ
ncbi:hypothetical protein BH18ACT11_BH18ACT11_25350 [soil metagenome]